MNLWLKVMVITLAAAAGAGLGAASFFLLTSPSAGEDVTIGPWRATTAIGEADQNPYSRARVALYGIWGLPSSEAVYYTATSDGDGRPITERCTYRVSGREAPARWWSLTVYRNAFYIDNPYNRYSWNSSITPRNADGTWEIILSAEGKEPNGLALGRRAGQFQLSYRLYQPSEGIAHDRSRAPLPQIERIGCLD